MSTMFNLKIIPTDAAGGALALGNTHIDKLANYDPMPAKASFSAEITNVNHDVFDMLIAAADAESARIANLPEFKAIAARIEWTLIEQFNGKPVSIKDLAEAAQKAAGCGVTVDVGNDGAAIIAVPWPPVTT